MKAITLRNIPPEVLKAIQRKARENKVSANRAVIELLQERVGILKDSRTTTYDDLDALAGTWTEKESRAFDEVIAASRQIDEELGK
jgi:hypothetical protein